MRYCTSEVDNITLHLLRTTKNNTTMPTTHTLRAEIIAYNAKEKARKVYRDNPTPYTGRLWAEAVNRYNKLINKTK